MVNIYGDGVHMIAYPINDTQISWACVILHLQALNVLLTVSFSITQREAEERETWRDMDEARQREFKNGPFSRLPCGGGDLVRTADKIIKVSLRQSTRTLSV